MKTSHSTCTHPAEIARVLLVATSLMVASMGATAFAEEVQSDQATAEDMLVTETAALAACDGRAGNTVECPTVAQGLLQQRLEFGGPR